MIKYVMVCRQGTCSFGSELRVQGSVAVGEYSSINEKAPHFCEASTSPERTKVAT